MEFKQQTPVYITEVDQRVISCDANTGAMSYGSISAEAHQTLRKR